MMPKPTTVADFIKQVNANLDSGTFEISYPIELIADRETRRYVHSYGLGPVKSPEFQALCELWSDFATAVETEAATRKEYLNHEIFGETLYHMGRSYCVAALWYLIQWKPERVRPLLTSVGRQIEGMMGAAAA